MHFNFSDKFFINVAMILWFLFVVAVCIIVGQQGEARTVTINYLDASNLWMHGKDLYNSTGRGFIYLPQAAVLFMPFAYLAKFSFAVSEIAWRLVSLLLLIFSIWRFSNLVEQKSVARTFFIITVVTLPLVFSSARNGQFNTILEAIMLLAVCSVAKERWSQAVFYLILGFALKPTMIVLLLLLWGLYRPLWWRMPLGLLAILIFPFLAQSPHYVVAQYLSSVDMLQIASTVGSNNSDWAQFFGLLAQLKLMPPQIFQDIIRVIAAIFVFYCGIRVRKKFDKNLSAVFLYALVVSYLMLFNPRTECNDYGIIAPVVGIFISLFLACNYRGQMWLLVSIIVGLIMSGNFTFIMGSGGREYWSAPFFTIIFAVVVIRQLFVPLVFLQNQNS
jgi:hypothetical protein